MSTSHRSLHVFCISMPSENLQLFRRLHLCPSQAYNTTISTCGTWSHIPRVAGIIEIRGFSLLLMLDWQFLDDQKPLLSNFQLGVYQLNQDYTKPSSKFGSLRRSNTLARSNAEPGRSKATRREKLHLRFFPIPRSSPGGFYISDHSDWWKYSEDRKC